MSVPHKYRFVAPLGVAFEVYLLCRSAFFAELY
jgi:hypothetical protein